MPHAAAALMTGAAVPARYQEQPEVDPRPSGRSQSCAETGGPVMMLAAAQGRCAAGQYENDTTIRYLSAQVAAHKLILPLIVFCLVSLIHVSGFIAIL